MAKAEWGVKRICPHCGARYYDMKKKPPVCPSCGTAIDLEALPKARRARPVAEEKPVKNKPLPPDADDLEIAPHEEDETAVIEDADELGEDDLDVEDVVELDDEKEEL